MLTLNFCQQFNNDGQQEMSWNSPIFTIDGIDYDLSLVPDGATARTLGILHYVIRNGNNYTIEVQLNCAFDNCPESTRFPAQQIITTNGSINVPIYQEIVEEEPQEGP